MYISKYWYNYIGGTDDSLTLADYLYSKGKEILTLEEIFKDTGLDKQNWNFHETGKLDYTSPDGRKHDFYYSINIITDLAALLLESRKSGFFCLRELFNDSKMNRNVCITTTNNEDLNFDRALSEFVKDPSSYDLSKMVDMDDIKALAKDVESVRYELYG